jgi:hypothetical protein
MNSRLYLFGFALVAGCASEPTDDVPNLPPPPPPPAIAVQRVQVAPQPRVAEPKPQPANPFAKAIQAAGGQFPPAQEREHRLGKQLPPGAPAAQEDPTPTFQRIFAQYAAKVAEVERASQGIATRDSKRRNRYYWDPINGTATDLQEQFHIDSSLLAQIIQLGLRENWPTTNPGDGDACTKMLRRAKVERALAMRRADAEAGDVVLGQILALGMQRELSAYAARDAAFQAWARRMVGVKP